MTFFRLYIWGLAGVYISYNTSEVIEMYGQYNPYMGAVPQMQQRLNTLQGYQQQQGYQPQMGTSYLKGRLVTGVEEARAAQIDLDGSSTFFPSLAEGRIYEKSIDLNGVPVFKVYELAKQGKHTDVVTDLQKRVERIEQRLGGVRYESVPANADVTVSKQSNGNVATASRQQSNTSKGNADGAGQRYTAVTADSEESCTPAWYE
jgi:hypothetical protein